MELSILKMVLVWVLAACSANASSKYYTVLWDSEDGLPHNAAYEIVQTPDGYVWLATQGGLARFDGFKFQRVEASVLRDRHADSIRQLALDREGFVLAAPEAGGLAKASKEKVEPHPASEQLAGARIASLHPLKDGTLWFSLYGGELCRWADGRITRVGKMHRSGSGRVTMAENGDDLWVAVGDFIGVWRDGAFREVRIPARPSYQITAADDGIWAAGEDGLVKIAEGKAGDRIPWGDGMSAVRAMREDSSGTLWVGTVDSGLFRLEGGEFVPGPTTHPEVACLMEDREGNLWVGTIGGGVYLVKRRWVTVFDSRMELPQDVSFSICETPDGAVWFANRSGGLMRWENGEMRMAEANFTGDPGPTVVSPAKGGGLYVGTDGGLFYLPEARGRTIVELEALRGNAIRCLHLTTAGELWASTTSGLLGRCEREVFKPADLGGLQDAMVSAISEDADGRIIVGTTSGELFRLEEGRFNRVEFNLPHRLSTVLAIAPHPDGTLWAGTSADGLMRLRDGEVLFFTAEDGLPDDAISQLVWEDEATLWAGSRSGIWRVPLEQLNSGGRIYPLLLGRSDGVSAGSCIGSFQPVSIRGSDGNLWFATRRGTVRVDSEGFDSKPRAIPVHLEGVEIDGNRQPPSGVVRGDPLAEKYQFEYTGLLFSAPERLQFRHRLAGYDSEWIYAGPLRQASYSQLPPGDYRFEVQARSPRGEWMENGPSLALVVPPAWWQRASVQVLLALSAAGLLTASARAVAIRRFRRQMAVMRQKQAVESERARIARDLHDDLGAALTHLSQLGHFGSAAESREELRSALMKVSRKARNLAVQMDAIVWTVNPKNDSLPHLAEYLSYAGLEFFRELPIRFRVDRPPELAAVQVSPDARHHILMVTKEAFANAASHSGGTEVWLRMGFDGEQFRLEIADNGRGMKVNERLPGNGLRNMRTRAREMGGELMIISDPGSGTRVIVRTPLKERDEN